MSHLSKGTVTDGVYVGGPTNQNKYYGKSGGGEQYIVGTPRF